MNVVCDWAALIRVGFPLILAFLITGRFIPTVNHIAREKGLLNKPGERTSHRYNTPNLAGVSLFIAFTLCTIIFVGDSIAADYRFWYAALFIIFFVGLKDDILILSPDKKLVAQFIAAGLIIYGNLSFTSLHGFLGYWEIKETWGAILALFAIVGISNAINLIDGIDGLGATIGGVILSTFGVFFLVNSDVDWAIMCFAMVGSLGSFYRFNVFGLRNKTFMGDSGSLVLGTLIAMCTIHFNEFCKNPDLFFPVSSAPAVSLGILILPIFDLARVSTIRLSKKTSPFAADKNHLHHRLLELGFNHFQSSLILGGVNLCFIILSFFCKDIGVIRLGIVLLVLCLSGSVWLEMLVKKHRLNA